MCLVAFGETWQQTELFKHGLKTKAKPRGNKKTQELAPLWEGMQLITREANLNSKIQNLGKAETFGKRHFGLFKDLVLIVGRVIERNMREVPLYL